MKRSLVLLMAAGLLVGVLGTPGVAQEGPPPPHPHMLVLGLEFDGEEPVDYKKCVDVAGNRAVPLNAHHAHIHTGTAGEMLATNAGHAVVPGAPLTPWANCQELIAFFFGE
jgi:hypothetical protein